MDRVMRRINVKTLSSISFGATAGTKPRMPINRKTTPNKSASVLAPQRQQVIDLARDASRDIPLRLHLERLSKTNRHRSPRADVRAVFPVWDREPIVVW